MVFWAAANGSLPEFEKEVSGRGRPIPVGGRVNSAVARTLDDTLYMSICDNGIGGADSRHGSGIIGLKDRVDAFGGTLTVNSPVGSGTTIDVTIPLAMPPR
jgi:signal transduction histidine kinase